MVPVSFDSDGYGLDWLLIFHHFPQFTQTKAANKRTPIVIAADTADGPIAILLLILPLVIKTK